MLSSPTRRLAAAACSFTLVLAGCQVRTVAVPPPVEQGALPPPVEPSPPPPEAPPPPGIPRSELVDVGGKTDVAVLLPLTGPNAALGNDMLDAAQLALSELAGEGLALTPKDTHGTPEGAAAAAQHALAEGAKLIIGPLTAPEVAAIKPIAAAANVDVIAFSNQVQVAGAGVFIMGFLPQQETRRVASYAFSTGIKEFAVLAPSTPYGQLAAQSFKDAVSAIGGTVDDVEYYDPGSGDPRTVIKALAGGGKPAFTAVLLPDSSPQRLRNVASLLPVMGIAPPDVHLLGTDAWDVPNLGTEPSLVGGWYAAPPPDARVPFQQRFQQAYGHTPARLATLAYDAVGIAAVLQKTPGNSFSTEQLTNPSGFAGADGVFRLLSDGTTERGLAVLQVEHNGTTVVSPAPESFQETGQ